MILIVVFNQKLQECRNAKSKDTIKQFFDGATVVETKLELK